MKSLCGILCALFFALLAGCGGGNSADFSLVVAPSTVAATAGGSAQQLAITASALNGFSGAVSVAVSGLPAGVTVSPATFSVTPGSLRQISISAGSSAAAGSATLTLTGTSGVLTHTATASLTVGAAPLPADFSLAVAPATVAATADGSAQQLTVTSSALNGFSGAISVAVSGLPAGVTVSPSTFSVMPGSLRQISIAAGSTAAAGSATITLTGTSGALTHTATASLTVAAAPPPATTAALSASAYDFGDNLVNNTRSEPVVTVTNTGVGILTLSPVLSGDASYSLVTGGSAGGSCGAQLAAGAKCDVLVSYKPTSASSPASQSAVLTLGLGNVPAGTPQTVQLSGVSAALAAGVVTATNNPQVALYTMTLPFPGSITVNFGKDTSYGFKTWSQSADAASGQVSIFVAGMLASTTYHMQAAVEFTNGIAATDTDHTFTTQAVPANMQPSSLTAGAAAGMTPQRGLEMLDALAGTPTGVMVADLSGNLLWTYANPGDPTLNFIDGVKMLPNGDLLMAIGPTSAIPLSGPVPSGSFNVIREVNLGGDTVREITIKDLNVELASATCAECNVSLLTFHHDVTPLPNGHWLVIANTTMPLSATSTPQLTNEPAQTVLGDVIVDLDENMQPVWVWNEFNHLDPNRHPMSFPDWTHTNAVLYSADDGNIVVSIRHQNWILKVDYANGTGTGNILWHLGYQGDFTLKNGTDPVDWQYAEHGPSFFSSNTSGVFSLGVFDNGDDRVFPAGVTCGSSGAPPCLYSTVPVWQVDESAKTATLTFHQILPANLYSLYGGNAEQLANGNVEYDVCSVGTPGSQSYVYEVTQQSTPQTVWSMHVTGTNFYRAFRIPSFYPGVQW